MYVRNRWKESSSAFAKPAPNVCEAKAKVNMEAHITYAYIFKMYKSRYLNIKY